jgi:hypothetical protein
MPSQMTSQPAEKAAPRLFISYSHDSREHEDQVRALADRLRDHGIDAVIDQYDAAPPDGWPMWMDREIQRADFIALVCTETYLRRVEGRESPGKGRGVLWEAKLIYNHLYVMDTAVQRFIPIFLEAEVPSSIPWPLRGLAYYQVNTAEGYEEFLRHLSGQPRHEKGVLGRLKALPMLAPQSYPASLEVRDTKGGTEPQDSVSFYLAMEGGRGESDPAPAITSTMFWFQNLTDNTGEYMALSPVDLSLILRVVNTGPKASGISSYEAEAQTVNGEWVKLWTAGLLHYEAVQTDGGLERVSVFDLNRCGFDRLLGRVILKPNENFIRGWAFFEFSTGAWNDYVGKDHPLTIRMNIHTLDGKSFMANAKHETIGATLATQSTIYFPNRVDLRKARILNSLPGWERQP